MHSNICFKISLSLLFSQKPTVLTPPPVVTLKKKKSVGSPMNPFSIKPQIPKVVFFSNILIYDQKNLLIALVARFCILNNFDIACHLQESPSATGLKAKVIRPPPSDPTPRSSARLPPSTPALPVERQGTKVEELEEEEGKNHR